MVTRLFSWICLALGLWGASSRPAQTAETQAPNTSLTNAAWRVTVYEFAKTRLQHTAWGLPHAERNFLLAQRLAAEEKLEVDQDILFAAAFLHDVAAFEAFGKVDVDHTEHGAEVAAEFLAGTGFAKEKIPAVQEAIREHMFYSRVGGSPEAIVLHDADTLDFLGAVGIARIFSLTTRHRWATDLKTAVGTIDKFSKELPAKLVTAAGKKIAETRVAEMKSFLDALDLQTHSGKSL